MSFSTEVYSYNLLHAWQVRNLESPWRFNQIGDDTVNHPAGKPVYLQRHREVIAHALATAFDTFTYYLGFFPRPEYIVDELVMLDQRYDWWDQKLQLSKRYLIEFGTRATEELGVINTDSRQDIGGKAGQDDHVTFTFDDIGPDYPHPVTSIKVFYRTVSLFEYTTLSSFDPQYEIPIEIIDQNRSLHLVSHLSDIIRPFLWRIPYDKHGNFNVLPYKDPDVIDPNIGRSSQLTFVESVDSARVYTNSTNAVRLLTVSDNYSVSPIETPVSPYYIDKQKGFFGLHRGSANLPVGSRPYAVKVSYLSGYPVNNIGNMNPHLEEGIIRLANTNLATADIPLSSPSQLVWNKDTQGLYEGVKGYQVPPEYVNPLGLLYGHVAAWATIREFADEVVGRVKTW